MILRTQYFWFSSALSSKDCDNIIQFSKKKSFKKASVYQNGNIDKSRKDLKFRKTDVTWLDLKPLYDLITPYVQEANIKSGWNFNINGVEKIQLAKYEKGAFFDWHPDQMEEPFNDPTDKRTFGKIRKLSVSINLSNPKDYTGGDFKMLLPSKDPKKLKEENIKQIKPRGSIVIFPSFVKHCVTKIKKGTRYSLVLWYLGERFK